MKKIVNLLLIVLFTGLAGWAQDDGPPEDRGGKLLERMQQYIQKRLNMTATEAERFSPSFIRYIADLRRTHREFRNDRPVLQLKIAELRVRYRDEWRPMLNEQRANRVFVHQTEFENKIRQEIMERRMQHRRGGGGGRIQRDRFINQDL